MCSLLTLAFLVLTAACSKSRVQQEEGGFTITVGGSSSVSPLVEMFKAVYENANEGISVSVSASGSGDGIRGAAEGTFEIGMTSRPLVPLELGTDVRQHLIALDGIGIIVNNASPVSNLSQAQLRGIYTGSVTRWEELGAAASGASGAIAVVSRESASGTRGAFEELLGFQDQLVGGAIEFNGTGAVKAEVSRNVHAIAYISLGSVDDTVKLINVDGVEASSENVRNGFYQIARPFILLTRRSTPPNENTQAFLDWILGSEAQAIVGRSWISVQ